MIFSWRATWVRPMSDAFADAGGVLRPAACTAPTLSQIAVAPVGALDHLLFRREHDRGRRGCEGVWRNSSNRAAREADADACQYDADQATADCIRVDHVPLLRACSSRDGASCQPAMVRRYPPTRKSQQPEAAARLSRAGLRSLPRDPSMSEAAARRNGTFCIEPERECRDSEVRKPKVAS
jgi:hypothetical protein